VLDPLVWSIRWPSRALLGGAARRGLLRSLPLCTAAGARPCRSPRLGYVGLGADDLTAWTEFATGLLGMQMVERGNASRAFRMDDRKQRLILDRALPEGDRYFGWEVADAAALDALAAHLEAAGVAVRREPAALAGQRCVTGLISFADPAGNRLEAFHGAQLADTPFRPGRTLSGFKTGAQGMGHAVLMVPRIEDVLPF